MGYAISETKIAKKFLSAIHGYRPVMAIMWAVESSSCDLEQM
jgi:hypothetical protein